MKVIKVNASAPEGKKLQLIVNMLKEGKALVLPTDTAYGLCANALDERAVERIFKIKERLKSKPLSVMVRDIGMAKTISYIQDREEKILKRYLPGPFTFVLQKKKVVPDILTAGQNSIGIRIPDNKVVKKIMEKVDFPLTATSANVSDELPPYSVGEVLEQYKSKKEKPDLIVGVGRLPKVKPSTVVDLTCDPPRVLREGPVKFELRVNEFMS
jgi:L-threonylcarbamoyladenylate synthase